MVAEHEHDGNRRGFQIVAERLRLFEISRLGQIPGQKQNVRATPEFHELFAHPGLGTLSVMDVTDRGDPDHSIPSASLGCESSCTRI